MDIERKLGIEGPGQRGQKRAHRHGDKSGPCHVDPERHRRLRLLAAGHQVVAEFVAGDQIGQQHDSQEHDQDDVIVRLLGGEHEMGEADVQRRNLQSPRAVQLQRADVVDIFDHDPEPLGKGDGRQGKIGTAHLQGGQTDDHPGDGRQHPADQHADPRADAVLQRQDGRGVGADADKGGVAKGQDAGKTADDIPAGGQIGIKEQQDQDVQIGGAADHQRQPEGYHQEADKRDFVDMLMVHCMSPYLLKSLTESGG
ncbi:MAG: hypothetical protein ACD_75C01113G0002 [uncultured bacterium]|nr:MAG: hypothetical protein ACD_75C01113G0002 [uncultured bacterium]